ncbi:MAG: outer membrane beta-barrel protein, partial [Terriglobales bacterium]
LNAIPYGATFLSQNQDPTKVAANPKAPLGSNAYDANFIRPYHGYGDIILHEYGGTSNYNSLQVSVNRRFVKGLFLGTAYTWSKALTTVSGDGDFFRIDGLTRAANYGRASFDVRHNLVFNYIYDAGEVTQYLGGFNNFVSRAVLNNWQISGIARFITGTPFGVGFGVNGIGNQNITGSYTEPARIVLNGNPLQGTTDSPYNRLNAAAFSLPAVGSIGLGAPVNYLSNPGINNFDLSLEKRFPVTERTAFTIRADAFNAFNHVQFTGINNGLSYSSLTSTTPNNLVYKADGTLNNINGFGSVNGARDPRIMQFAVRFEF